MELGELNAEYEHIAFKNNPNLRPCGVKFEYTMEQMIEIQKCMKDPIYFIENYFRVIHPDKGSVLMKLYDYQKKMILAYHNNRRVVAMASRQLGKCCTLNTKVSLKNKKTGIIYQLTLGEFYEWQVFKELFGVFV